MSVRELRDWKQFEQHHPLPDLLADLHHALLCGYVINIARSSDAIAVNPLDLLVIREPEPPGVPVREGEIERHIKSWRGG